jgi:hypothetical protein
MKTSTLMIAAALVWGAIAAQTAAQPSSTATAPPGSAQVEPGAVEALSKMSAYLRSIPAFQINLQTERDDVDAYGQLIKLSGQATYKVRRPDAFLIDLALPDRTEQYVYDGKTVTAYDPKTGQYGKFQAPSTIRATLELAAEKYGASVPLEDLFAWSDGDDHAKALTSAHFVGKDKIGGQTASHYAYRQPGMDWQIWIADGDKPAPVRVSMVAPDDPARPQFEADLSWDTTPQFAADTFVFAPPPNARAVVFRSDN